MYPSIPVSWLIRRLSGSGSRLARRLLVEKWNLFIKVAEMGQVSVLGWAGNSSSRPLSAETKKESIHSLGSCTEFYCSLFLGHFQCKFDILQVICHLKGSPCLSTSLCHLKLAASKLAVDFFFLPFCRLREFNATHVERDLWTLKIP